MTKEEQHDGSNIVAIDGPAGAGKSSVSRETARVLDFAFLDTGAMYRAATWRALHQQAPMDDPEALVACTEEMRLDLKESPEGVVVLVDGRDVSEDIRTPEVTRQIYRLDQVSGVRRRLVELQRRFGRRRPTVAEGRDIGTVVFPEARCKIYLDASLECRAGRRAAELKARGTSVDMEELMREIAERDAQSMNRTDSPLRKADDAILVDTTNLSFEQVVSRLVHLARERL